MSSADLQRERVLAALRAHRRHGITAVDFDLPDVIDGEAPIQRVAARIHDLRKRGYQITSNERRNKCTVYRLVGDVEDAAVATNGAPASPGPCQEDGSGDLNATLFTEPPRLAIFDDEQAA